MKSDHYCSLPWKPNQQTDHHNLAILNFVLSKSNIAAVVSKLSFEKVLFSKLNVAVAIKQNGHRS